ncbi:MAG: putative methyltransferase type 11, partial [Firmicutes bacterium]|nr:putative methyltransferase type 11 [Bacillota bacterium]
MFGVHYNSVVNAFLKEEEVKDKAILDIGSLVINSRSARFIVAPYEPKEYIGIDTISGVGVDKVCCIEDLLVEYGEEKFDIILMTAMLEVTKDYQSAISAAKRLCKKNGIMILTARTGRHPKDLQRNEYWRYEEDDIQTLFADCNIVMKANDSNFTEIFFKIIKPQDVIEINYEHIELYSSILNR